MTHIVATLSYSPLLQGERWLHTVVSLRYFPAPLNWNKGLVLVLLSYIRATLIWNIKHTSAALGFFWATLIWNMGHIAINLCWFPITNCNCSKLIPSYCQLKLDTHYSCSELNGEIQQTYLLLLATFQVLWAETWHT